MTTGNLFHSIAAKTKKQSVASDKMMNAVNLWMDIFYGNAPWLKDNPLSLRIPNVLTSEIARAVTLEMEVNITGSKMADFISEQFEELRDNMRSNTEYACAGGGLVFKPYVCGNKIVTEVILANSFYPTAYDGQKITGALFIYRIWRDNKVYSRLEEHELKGTTYTITNKAYVSKFEGALGDECSLTAVENWKDIDPVVKLTGIESPLFSYFKIPLANPIDDHAPIGSSVFALCTDLIKEADLQFQRLIWEYEAGEMAIDASEDAFYTVNGIPSLPKGKERLFRINQLDAARTNGEHLLKEWAPELRDSNYMSGLNRILIQIEDDAQLSRGTLSDPSEVSKTATEITMMKQRSYATISDIQKALERALNELAYSMYCLAVLYELCPDGDYVTTYVWDDSIIVDAETERVRDQQEVAQGLMLPYEYRMKWYGEDEETAKKMTGYKEPQSDDDILGFNNKLTNDEDDNKEDEDE